MTSANARCLHSCRGFTLVEIVVTISLLSISLLAVIYGSSMSAKHSADATWQAKTAYIGQAYLEEILTKRFDENSSPDGLQPCGSGVACSTTMRAESGEARTTYDDVDDFNGLNETPLTTLAPYFGNVNPYQGYNVRVTVSYSTAAGITTANMVKLIVVRVTPPGNLPSAQFSAFKGNY